MPRNRLTVGFPNTTTAGNCQTPSGQISGDERQGIDGYGGKVKVSRQEWNVKP